MKGVSPLLAGVLMIAFVMVVAAIVGGWLTSITRTETSIVETGFTTQVNCSKGIIEIVSANLDDPGTDQVNVVINNIGQLDLTGFTIFAKDDGNNVETKDYPTTTLGAGAIANFSTSAAGLGGLKLSIVRITSHTCPSVWAEKTNF